MQKVEASIPVVSMNQMLYSKKSLHISSALRFTSMLIFFLHSISPEISSFQVKSSSNLGIPRASEEQVSGGPAQLIYRIEEEVPRDTVVGHLAEDILQEIYGMVAQTPGMVGPGRESSLVSLMGLSIANRRERGTHHFQIDSATGNLVLASPPDREMLCPLASTGKPTYSDVNPAACVLVLRVAYHPPSFSPTSSLETELRTDVTMEPQLITVHVVIEDINDHPPRFPVDRLTEELGEITSEPEVTYIELPSASDPDAGANGSITYWLVSQDSLHDAKERSDEMIGGTQSASQSVVGTLDTRNHLPFRLELAGISSPMAIPSLTERVITTSEQQHPLPMRLVLSEALDWEQKREYRLVVMARDSGSPVPRTGQLQIDVTVRDENDNRPIFDSPNGEYIVVINESIPQGSNVLRITAEDKDGPSNGQVIY